MPNVVRGGDTHGLMRYLVGPGRANEHQEPHLVSTSPDIEFSALFIDGELDYRTATHLADHLDLNMSLTGRQPMGKVWRYNYEEDTRTLVSNTANHVWHCSLSLSPDEPSLSDEQWGEVAQDFMTKMHFNTDNPAHQCAWLAVHHGKSKNGGDHIHIVANTVRADGSVWSMWNDWSKAQAACNYIETKYGLAKVESREHNRGSINDPASALNHAARTDNPKTERAQLETKIRAAATASRTEAEFVTTARSTHKVLIRPRYAKGSNEEVVGYSVALPSNTGQRTWYGGGRLGRDLTLTRLRQNWDDTPERRAEALSHWRAKRGEHVPHAKFDSHLVDQAKDALNSIDPTDPHQLANATSAVAGVLSAAAERWGNTPAGHHLDQAARQVGRSAQTKQHRHTPIGPYFKPLNALARIYTHAQPHRSDFIDALILMKNAAALALALAELYTKVNQLRTAHVIRRDTKAAFDGFDAQLRQTPWAHQLKQRQYATAGMAYVPGVPSPTDGMPQWANPTTTTSDVHHRPTALPQRRTLGR